MTQFFYGATAEDAKTMAVRGAILSPLMLERAWLQQLKEKDKDYYDELIKGKSIDSVAYDLALTDVQSKEHINKILLTRSVTHSLLRLARSQEPKVILGLEFNHPPTMFVPVPGPIYLEQLTDVRLYEDAMEHKTELMKAFGKYTDKFYLVKKK